MVRASAGPGKNSAFKVCALAGMCGFGEGKYGGIEKLLKCAVLTVHGDVGAAGLKLSAREGWGEGKEETPAAIMMS